MVTCEMLREQKVEEESTKELQVSRNSRARIRSPYILRLNSKVS